MPDEKIDQKRPIGAEHEPRPLQQRHVDDTVDDSFPASDPPAWTTSASKSVAAECEPDALNEVPTPPGQSRQGGTDSTAQSRIGQASDLAHSLYGQGRTYLERGRRYLPEAERYYRQGAEAMSRPVQEHPLAMVLAVGVLGCTLGWLLGRRSAGAASVRQWNPGSNERSKGSQNRRPAPKAVYGRGHLPDHNEAEVASHTNNSF